MQEFQELVAASKTEDIRDEFRSIKGELFAMMTEFQERFKQDQEETDMKACLFDQRVVKMQAELD